MYRLRLAVLIKNKTEDTRMCIDYRRLNNVTKLISFPLHRLQEVFETLTEAQPNFFTLVDLKSGYHQILLDLATKDKTIFVIYRGASSYKRMPFGLVNAPASFQSLMPGIFRNMTQDYVLVYIDDLLIYSRNMHDHLIHLQNTFDKLKQAYLQLNPSK